VEIILIFLIIKVFKEYNVFNHFTSFFTLINIWKIKLLGFSLIIDSMCQENIKIKIRFASQGIRTHWDHGLFLFIYLFLLLLLLLWYNRNGNHLEEDIAKFCHKTCRTFKIL
jgi:hypothetical protein